MDPDYINVSPLTPEQQMRSLNQDKPSMYGVMSGLGGVLGGMRGLARGSFAGNAMLGAGLGAGAAALLVRKRRKNIEAQMNKQAYTMNSILAIATQEFAKLAEREVPIVGTNYMGRYHFSTPTLDITDASRRSLLAGLKNRAPRDYAGGAVGGAALGGMLGAATVGEGGLRAARTPVAVGAGLGGLMGAFLMNRNRKAMERRINESEGLRFTGSGSSAESAGKRLTDRLHQASKNPEAIDPRGAQFVNRSPVFGGYLRFQG